MKKNKTKQKENLITTAGPAQKNTVAREARASAAQTRCGPGQAPASARRLTSGSHESVRQTGEEEGTTA